MAPQRPAEARTFLITGGSGTFGVAFIRHLLRTTRARIISMSRNSEMRYRLQQAFPDPRLTVIPGDVRQPMDVAAAFRLATVDVVIHAAAEKHISTGQDFGPYTYDINVNGARNVVETAHRYGSRIVALSTDKACEPVNYYGETKREAEKLFIAAGHTVVRYGNVTGSSGSVLPLFVKQRSSGRITITDRRMTRFFMPVSYDAPWNVVQEPGRQPVMSAVELVDYAMKDAAVGGIYVPTIPSGSIVNLAEQIGPGCTIEEIGIRDGEKLHEQLIAANEIPRTYRLTQGVYVVMPRMVGYMEPVESSFRHASDVDPQPLVVEEVAA